VGFCAYEYRIKVCTIDVFYKKFNRTCVSTTIPMQDLHSLPANSVTCMMLVRSWILVKIARGRALQCYTVSGMHLVATWNQKYQFIGYKELHIRFYVIILHVIAKKKFPTLSHKALGKPDSSFNRFFIWNPLEWKTLIHKVKGCKTNNGLYLYILICS